MEIVLGLIGIIIACLIPVFAFLWKKYFSRPEVTIEIIKTGGLSQPRGISSRTQIDLDGNLVGDNLIKLYELTWNFKIRITNNSELTAFYPELYFNPNGPKFMLIDEMNRLRPIKTTETYDLSVEYRKFEEKNEKERTDIGKEMPIEFNNLGILLSYQNSYKTNFYTLYNFNSNKNEFIKRKPIEYKNN